MKAKDYMLDFYLRNMISKTKATGGFRLPSYLLNFEPTSLDKTKELLEAYKSGDYNLLLEEEQLNKLCRSIG